MANLMYKWCLPVLLLLAAPGMAGQSTQTPEQSPPKSEAASRAQAVARDSARAKASGKSSNDGEVEPGRQPAASTAQPAPAKATDDKAAENNGSGPAVNGAAGPSNGGPSSAGSPQGPQRSKGAATNDEQLRKDSQNPVAHLISFPLQNNTNMRIEPADRNQNVLNIQPVIPVSLNDN